VNRPLASVLGHTILALPFESVYQTVVGAIDVLAVEWKR